MPNGTLPAPGWEEWGPLRHRPGHRRPSRPRPDPHLSSTPRSSLTTVKALDADLNTLTFRADLWISEHVNPERVVDCRSHRDAPAR